MPDKPEGWIDQGSALTELNRHEEARTVLLQGYSRFPDDEIIGYDLACVCRVLDREVEATRWLRKAITVAGDEMWKRASEDPDLETIHQRLLTAQGALGAARASFLTGC